MMDDKVMLIVGKKEEGVLKLPASSHRYKMEAPNFNGSDTELNSHLPPNTNPLNLGLDMYLLQEVSQIRIYFLHQVPPMHCGCAPSQPLQSYFCTTCPGDGSNTE